MHLINFLRRKRPKLLATSSMVKETTLMYCLSRAKHFTWAVRSINSTKMSTSFSSVDQTPKRTWSKSVQPVSNPSKITKTWFTALFVVTQIARNALRKQESTLLKTLICWTLHTSRKKKLKSQYKEAKFAKYATENFSLKKCCLARPKTLRCTTM